MACGAKMEGEGPKFGAEAHAAWEGAKFLAASLPCHAPGKVQKILIYCRPTISAKNKILMSAQISVETYLTGGNVAVNPTACSR